MTRQLKARHKPIKARRLGKSDEPTSLQMALFTFVTLFFSLPLHTGGVLARYLLNGNRGTSSAMHGKHISSCLIQYLLNDLYFGIKKEPFTKGERPYIPIN